MSRLPLTRGRRGLFKRPRAKKLRTGAPEPERILWGALRAKRTGGLRFRRQQPIGPYIVDFYCSAASLVIELDGQQHGERGERAYDSARTTWLAARGYQVIRFWNNDVLKDCMAVVEAILMAAAERGVPLPEPPKAVRPSLKGRVEQLG